ncbi:enoyl-CoA hydratase-related protein [Actinoplanes oblitus]|uniref:Enoyl-CoA hydratase-related protein n=1 Tax=Actinoplanes oblitus TaxID=3040509 RepID=A0ABY8WDC0_9ACTN|nr:enoyl-CoA-hydratase DpgB [Actinoplanes oblitus]WIM94394.1 enoyl-CoA hydratase-related protein [Actinoplanes oblitus]
MSVYIDGGEPLSDELVTSLTTAVERAEDGADRTLVLRAGGVPGTAGPGADLGIHLVNKWERTLRRLERVAAFTVTVVDRDCGGVALEALLATDYRVAVTGARLVPSPWPGMGLYRLANQAGAAAVRRAVLLGVPLTAAEALGLGLIDEVAADPDAAVAAARTRLGTASAADLAVRRRLLLDATTTSYEEALGRHLAACDRQLRRGPAEAAA